MVSLFVAALMVVLTPAGASALDAGPATPGAQPPLPSFVFQPANETSGGYFSLELKPGATQDESVLIGNSGTSPIDARTYAADAFTLDNGGFGLKSNDDPRTGVTTWLDYQSKELTLEPGKGVTVKFTVTTPSDLAPGQYITGLALETAEPIATGGNSSGQLQINQTLRTVIAVLITVPGPITPAFTIGAPTLSQETPTQSLTMPISNTGNILVKPSGNVRVTDASGKTMLTAPVQMGSVYAHDATTLSIALSQPLPKGSYVVSVDLHDAATGASASVSNAKIAARGEATPVSAAAIGFSSATATPKPSLNKLQFLEISATITNTGEPVTNARVVLHAVHDGATVEDFTLASSLALPTGDTVVQGRYLPADGWSTGTWTFSLTLEAVDAATGQTRPLGTATLGEPLRVP